MISNEQRGRTDDLNGLAARDLAGRLQRSRLNATSDIRRSTFMRRQRLQLVIIALPVIVVVALLFWPHTPVKNANSEAVIITTTTTTTASPACATTKDVMYQIDIDHDGCLDMTSYEKNVLTVGSQTFQLGEPGDLIALGDWSCQGQATAATLRPRTGEVFVFDGWPTSEEVTSTRLTIVPDAVGITAKNKTSSEECSDIWIDRRVGEPAILKVAKS